MNYIGSKLSLLKFLEESINKVVDKDCDTFCDLFAGTGIVGSYFKKKDYKIIANDIQYYINVLNRHYIGNHKELNFVKLIIEIPDLKNIDVRNRKTFVCNHLSDIKQLIKRISDFRDARDWKQFHNPKDCAISLALEAAEVLEHFQWKNPEEIKKYVETNKDEVSEELADVLYWVLLMSGDLNIDIVKAFDKKMLKNAKKYPVNKAKGKHTKYNKL